MTPVAVELDGTRHQVEIPLEIVAHHLAPGHAITLQVAAANGAYATPNRAGSVTFDDVTIDVPIASGVQRTP